MKSNPSLSPRPTSRTNAPRLLALAAAVYALPMVCLAGPGAKPEPPTVEKKPALSGVELWTINCSRCHTYRAPNEFTNAQWQTLLLHMRVRANLPPAQAREILKFLQDGSGK